jgi:hypothetical protein
MVEYKYIIHSENLTTTSYQVRDVRKARERATAVVRELKSIRPFY